MNEDGRWITTKSGNRVFIKSTNAYMNEKIRNKTNNKNKSKIYELYHSSSSDFEEFDDQYIGKASRGGLAFGKGHYFLDETNDYYGRFGYKVKVNLQKPFVVQEHDWSNELTKLGYNWYGVSRQDPSDFLASKGYDGTIIKNGERTAEIIVYSNNDKKIKIIEKTLNGKKIDN